MFRRVVILLVTLCLYPAMGVAQTREYVSNGDTIKYQYTPLAHTSASAEGASVVNADTTKRERSRFVQRFLDFATQDAIDRTFEKKIDFSIVPAPSYSRKTSLSLNLVATGVYRVDRSDSITSPSNVSLYGSVSIIGYYYLGVLGNTFFHHDRHRLDYDIGFQSMPTSFWGFGYQAAMTNPMREYVNKNAFGAVRYLYELFPNFNIGVLLDFEYTKAKPLKDKNKEYSFPEYFGDQRRFYTAFGQGVIIEYDSRDVITNPTKGLYVGANFLVRPKAFGNVGHTLWKASGTINFYQRLWRDAVLALDLHGEFNSRHTPWTMYALLGNNYRMRGYYEGQFTDLNMVTFQAELRQRVWRRLGVVAWGGAGNVFHSFDTFAWQQTLPNYGVGLRWELKRGISARIDYGFGGKVNGELVHGLVMSINEAF